MQREGAAMRIGGWMGLLGALAILAEPLAASAQRAEADPELPERATQVAPHVYVMPGYPNVGIVVGNTGTLVVDTGMGNPIGARVAREAARLSTRGQKLYLTTTHYHPEHAAGQGGFPPGVTVIRSRVQQAELESAGPGLVAQFARRSPEWGRLLEGPQVTRADVLFDQSYRLDLGGLDVGLYAFGPGHTEGDTIVHVEQDSLIFPGDIVESLRSPNIMCAKCSPQSWIAILDRIAPLKPAHVVPTHGPYLIDGSWIAREKAFLTDLQTRVMALKREGRTPAEATAVVTAELTARYPDWTGLTNLGQSVARAYAANP
jgi:glyoxylase-like metal-dependent hydrolase (beta-lactamase superfamily II)